MLSILAVKREFLALADDDGKGSCEMLLTDGRVAPSIAIPTELRASEREIMFELLVYKELSPDVQSYGAEQAALPSWAAEELRKRTDLSVDEINTVMRAEASPHACAIRGLIIEVVLERPDDAPLELLRLL